MPINEYNIQNLSTVIIHAKSIPPIGRHDCQK